MTFGRTDGRACVCGGRAAGPRVVAASPRVREVPLGPPYTMN